MEAIFSKEVFADFKSEIINSPVHLRIDDKDYIVLQLKNGELKILNRRGKDRVIVDEKIQFSNNSVFSFLKLSLIGL